MTNEELRAKLEASKPTIEAALKLISDVEDKEPSPLSEKEFDALSDRFDERTGGRVLRDKKGERLGTHITFSPFVIAASLGEFDLARGNFWWREKMLGLVPNPLEYIKNPIDVIQGAFGFGLQVGKLYAQLTAENPEAVKMIEEYARKWEEIVEQARQQRAIEVAAKAAEVGHKFEQPPAAGVN